MIRPIQTATDGLIFARFPLSIAIRGLLARAVVIGEAVSEYRGGGMRGDVWDLQDLAQERRRQFLIREDEEIFEMILQFIISGVSD